MRKPFSPTILALLVCGAGCAQTLMHPQFKSPHVFPEEQVVAARDLSWIERANKTWTGDNKPYQQIRASIDTAIVKGEAIDDLRQQYGLAAQQKPNDPLAQFAWAYSSWIASHSRTITEGKADEDLSGIPEALTHVSDPHTYDFYRLRFLLGGGKRLLPLGHRLLTVDPNDTDVKVQMVRISPNERTAVAGCNRLIEAYPQNPRYRSLLANVYSAAWAESHDEKDRLKSIAAINDFLRLSLPTDKRLGNAKYWLQLLSKPAKSE
jgi:hypothetical protein